MVPIRSRPPRPSDPSPARFRNDQGVRACACGVSLHRSQCMTWVFYVRAMRASRITWCSICTLSPPRPQRAARAQTDVQRSELRVGTHNLDDSFAVTLHTLLLCRLTTRKREENSLLFKFQIFSSKTDLFFSETTSGNPRSHNLKLEREIANSQPFVLQRWIPGTSQGTAPFPLPEAEKV